MGKNNGLTIQRRYLFQGWGRDEENSSGRRSLIFDGDKLKGVLSLPVVATGIEIRPAFHGNLHRIEVGFYLWRKLWLANYEEVEHVERREFFLFNDQEYVRRSVVVGLALGQFRGDFEEDSVRRE